MSLSRLFFIFFLSFIFGIFLRSLFLFSFKELIAITLLFLSLFLISLIFEDKKLLILSLSLLFLFFGILRYHLEEIRFSKESLLKFQNKEIVLRGKVIKEREKGERSDKILLKVEEILNKTSSEKFESKVLIYSKKYSGVNYGDILQVKGKLKIPSLFENLNYRDYLKKERISAIIYFPEIKILEKDKGNFFFKIIYSLKEKLRASISKNFSPPQSIILKAIVLGDKREIPKSFSEKLNTTGLRHIVTVSGLHFTILAGIIMSLFVSFRIHRGQSFYFTIVFLIFYLLMTGLQISAVRAFIMSTLFLYAQKIGRVSCSFRALIFSAFLMVLFDPFLLKFDVGFQLSFLAVSGIIFLSPFFQEKLKFCPLFLRDVLSFSFSAQLFILPLLLYNFGYFSLISPLTNILVLPFLPLLMVIGFLSSFIGVFFPLIGKIIFWFSWPILVYLTKIIEFFSSLSFSFLNFQISWFWLLISYSILGVIVWRLKEREKIRILTS